MRKLQPYIPWTLTFAFIGYLLAIGVVGIMTP
jgi:hypothetical protein